MTPGRTLPGTSGRRHCRVLSMPHQPGPPADPPDNPPNTPAPPPASADPPRFPSCRRVEPWGSFADRWRAKREDNDRFVEAVNQANAALPGGSRLPDALARDWVASWADDLFVGVIPRHERLTPEQVATAVEDVAAVVEALRLVERQRWIAGAQRVWFYELPGDPGLGLFPTADEVRRYAILSESQDERDTRRVVEFIQSHGGRITLRDFQRS